MTATEVANTELCDHCTSIICLAIATMRGVPR